MSQTPEENGDYQWNGVEWVLRGPNQIQHTSSNSYPNQQSESMDPLTQGYHSTHVSRPPHSSPSLGSHPHPAGTFYTEHYAPYYNQPVQPAYQVHQVHAFQPPMPPPVPVQDASGRIFLPPNRYATPMPQQYAPAAPSRYPGHDYWPPPGGFQAQSIPYNVNQPKLYTHNNQNYSGATELDRKTQSLRNPDGSTYGGLVYGGSNPQHATNTMNGRSNSLNNMSIQQFPSQDAINAPAERVERPISEDQRRTASDIPILNTQYGSSVRQNIINKYGIARPGSIPPHSHSQTQSTQSVNYAPPQLSGITQARRYAQNNRAPQASPNLVPHRLLQDSSNTSITRSPSYRSSQTVHNTPSVYKEPEAEDLPTYTPSPDPALAVADEKRKTPTSNPNNALGVGGSQIAGLTSKRSFYVSNPDLSESESECDVEKIEVAQPSTSTNIMLIKEDGADLKDGVRRAHPLPETSIEEGGHVNEPGLNFLGDSESTTPLPEIVETDTYNNRQSISSVFSLPEWKRDEVIDNIDDIVEEGDSPLTEDSSSALDQFAANLEAEHRSDQAKRLSIVTEPTDTVTPVSSRCSSPSAVTSTRTCLLTTESLKLQNSASSENLQIDSATPTSQTFNLPTFPILTANLTPTQGQVLTPTVGSATSTSVLQACEPLASKTDNMKINTGSLQAEISASDTPPKSAFDAPAPVAAYAHVDNGELYNSISTASEQITTDYFTNKESVAFPMPSVTDAWNADVAKEITDDISQGYMSPAPAPISFPIPSVSDVPTSPTSPISPPTSPFPVLVVPSHIQRYRLSDNPVSPVDKTSSPSASWNHLDSPPDQNRPTFEQAKEETPQMGPTLIEESVTSPILIAEETTSDPTIGLLLSPRIEDKNVTHEQINSDAHFQHTTASGLWVPDEQYSPVQEDMLSEVESQELFQWVFKAAYVSDILDHRAKTVKRQVSSAPPPFGKLPTAAIDVLTTKLEFRVRRVPTSHADILVHKSLEAFYKVISAKGYLKKYCKNGGTIEDLVVRFIQTAMIEIRKDQLVEDLADEIDRQVREFLQVLIKVFEGLPSSSSVVPVLRRYHSKLEAAAKADLPDLHLPKLPKDVSQFPKTMLVKDLFEKPLDEIRTMAKSMDSISVDQAAYMDTKACLGNLSTGAPFPASKDDFDSEDAYQRWKTNENTSLSSMITYLLGRDDSLLRISGNPEQHVFVLIPQDVNTMYSRLLGLVLGTGIITDSERKILNFCAERWRVLKSFRVASECDLIVSRVVNHKAKMYTVLDVLDVIEAMEDEPYTEWPFAHRLLLVSSLDRLAEALYPKLEAIFNPTFDTLTLEILARLSNSQIFLLEGKDLTSPSEQIRAVLLAKAMEIVGLHLSKEPDIVMLSDHISWVEKECVQYQKRFNKPILGYLNVASAFIQGSCQVLLDQLTQHVALIQSNTIENQEIINGLYQKTVHLKHLYEKYIASPPFPISYDLVSRAVTLFFEAFVNQMRVWLPRAIEQDNFEYESDTVDEAEDLKRSSSIIDLGTACLKACDSLSQYYWDDTRTASELTGLAQRIGQLLQRYGEVIEKAFIKELFSQIHEADMEESPNWVLAKAKSLVQSENKMEPFVFTPKLLVKLNDVQAARKLLDVTFFEKLKTTEEPRPLPGPPHYLFTVKIVSIAGLNCFLTQDLTALDTYVRLVKPGGLMVATRVMYGTLNPRWSQTFDVDVTETGRLHLQVFNCVPGGQDKILGALSIDLNPKKYLDNGGKDEWFGLWSSNRRQTGARVLVRITADLARHTVPFYMGRFSRALKRREKDMARAIVTKILPVLHGALSASNLASLSHSTSVASFQALSTAKSNLALVTSRVNLSDTSSKLVSLFKDAWEGDKRELIPEVISPEDDLQKQQAEREKREQKRKELMDKDHMLESNALNVIVDLLDYLDHTLGDLTESLAQDAWDLVMSRLWKESLLVLESLVLPPLGSSPVQMKRLNEKAMEIIFLWLQALIVMFHAEGEGIPMAVLQKNPIYIRLTLVRPLYDVAEEELWKDCISSMQIVLATRAGVPLPRTGSTIMGRKKSVYNRQASKRVNKKKQMSLLSQNVPKEEENLVSKETIAKLKWETILRILRMREGQTNFLESQIATFYG